MCIRDSFGVYDGFFGPRDGKDMECVINALAQEDWCTGKVGTYGGSNHGMIQEITLPVSYTHLDVYKRQVRLGLPPSGWRLPPPKTPR